MLANTKTNPREQVNGITLRSEKEFPSGSKGKKVDQVAEEANKEIKVVRNQEKLEKVSKKEVESKVLKNILTLMFHACFILKG